MSSLVDMAAGAILRHRMLEPGQKIGVAVSGGADSVCLLHVLRELALRWNLHLTVLHLNHRLRGQESDEDAQFVRQLAAASNLPIDIREAELRNSRDNLEEAARNARLAFFTSAIADHQLNRIATGHTRSDQAETVLFRFLRGSGTAGLAGIWPVTAEGIIRPLLEIDRVQVEEFLRERGIGWREDGTNRNLEFARNRIRRQLLPQLAQDWNPAIYQMLGQLADWCQAEEEYWRAEMDRLAHAHLIVKNGFVLLNIEDLRELPVAAARRLVRRAMDLVKGGLRAISFSHVEDVRHLADSTEGHGRLQVPDLDIMRSFEWLRFAPITAGLQNRNYRLPAPVPGVVPVPGTDFAISLQVFEKTGTFSGGDTVYNEGMVPGPEAQNRSVPSTRPGSGAARVDWDRLSGSLELRNWRPGDQYRPAGRASEEKIKTLFQEFRVPLWERRYWPILTEGDTIVWARRFGAAARFAAGDGAKTVLQIREVGIGQQPERVYMSGKPAGEVS